MSARFTEEVVRLRAERVADPYSESETALDWTAPDRRSLQAVVWDSKTVNQLVPGRNPVDADFTVSLAWGADVQDLDRIVVRGRVCNVQGFPFDHHSPYSGARRGRIVYASVREG